MFADLFHIIKSVGTGIIALTTALSGALSTNQKMTLLPSYHHTSTTTLVKKENPPSSQETSLTPLSTSTKDITSSPKKVVAPSTPKKVTTLPSKVKPVLKEIKKDELAVTLEPEKPALPPPTISKVNEDARKALVNILCTVTADASLRPLSGSGTIIDERGVVLTNAHIAQYFLLRDFPYKNNVDCIIRTGSPAQATYRGELIFISPPWIEANRKNITEDDPTGTGENDFALILITSSVDKNTPLPTNFPHVIFNSEEMDEKTAPRDSYVIVGYPAGFLGGLSVFQNLYIASTVATLNKLYTFKDGTIDLLSFAGNILAQKGASGGGVVRQSDEKLVGMVVTTTEEKQTSARALNTITTTHMNRSMEASYNKTVPEYLTGDLRNTLDIFQRGKFQYLKNILVNELTS